MPMTTRQTVQTARARITLFARGEDGSFVILGLYLLMAMLIVGGVAVDILRHDYRRVVLQSTIDTAVLAAADLDQSLAPKAVVESYAEKAGITDYIDNIKVTDSINSRVVSVAASAEVETMFINALGFDKLDLNTGGTAREDIRDVEVSMVLDISGSMGSYNRLANLKTASEDFVTTVLTAPDGSNIDGEVSVSLVPYSTQVNAGETVLDALNITDGHDYSNCIDFANDSDFSSTTLDRSATYRQTAHFDPFHYANTVSDQMESSPNWVCPTDSFAEITYFQDSITDLKTAINAFTPGANTSIDVGLKWGAALLDPDFRNITPDLVATSEADSDFSNRPLDWDAADAMKVLVVMTDGANTTQYGLKSDHSGDTNSDFWWVGSDLIYNRSEPGDKDGDGDWNEDFYDIEDFRFRDYGDIPNISSIASRLTWQDLWAVRSLDWAAWYGHAKGTASSSGENGAFNSFMNEARDNVGSSTKDTRMTSMCNAIKDAGVIIFAVALDITESNATLMEDCATSENHYFNVSGTEVITAFNAIATTINQLKLTQ